MSVTVLVVILLVLAAVVAFWLIRSRGNTSGEHIDTSMTAIGAVTEAVEDVVDAITHKVEEVRTPPAAPLVSPQPVEPVKVETAKVETAEAAAPKVKPATVEPTKPKPAAAENAPAKPAPTKPASAPAKSAAVASEVANAPVAAPAAKPAAAPAKSAPAEAASPKPAPKKAKSEPDDLRLLKGVGPKLATLLTELGVTRFDQIAAWKPADIERIDAQLGAFKGRPVRDNWVEQAAFLAKGDTEGFEAKFGKL
jgi:predicted flap endonuclease-1-like 5' DNA nuclease